MPAKIRFKNICVNCGKETDPQSADPFCSDTCFEAVMEDLKVKVPEQLRVELVLLDGMEE